jgi:hypothetical protein
MKLLILILAVSFVAPIAFAGWSQPVRLSPQISFRECDIGVGGNIVHVVAWPVNNYEFIYYFRSPDNGQTWEPERFLNDTTGAPSAYYSSLTLNDSLVCVFWKGPPGHMISKSYDEGLTWHRYPVNTYLEDYLGRDLALLDNTPYIISLDIWGYDEGTVIYFSRENFGDTTWQNQTRVAVTYGAFEVNTVYYDNIMHFVYAANYSDYGFYGRVYYSKSLDSGLTWTPPIVLSDSAQSNIYFLKLAANKRGELAVCYMNPLRYDGGTLYIRISHDNGETWEPQIQLNDDFYAYEPAIAWDDNTIAIVYQKNYGFRVPEDIFVRISNDKGETWSPEERLTDDSVYTRRQKVAVSHDTVYVIYNQSEDPGVIEQGLYFTRYDPEPQGVSHDSDIPKQSDLQLTAYPNPFNSETSISYFLPRSGAIKLTVYDIAGREAETLADGYQSSGERTVKWDASCFGSGAYFIKLQASGHSETTKLLLLK